MLAENLLIFSEVKELLIKGVRENVRFFVKKHMFFVTIKHIKGRGKGMLGEEAFGTRDHYIAYGNTRIRGSFSDLMLENTIDTPEKGFIDHGGLIVLVPLLGGSVRGQNNEFGSKFNNSSLSLDMTLVSVQHLEHERVLHPAVEVIKDNGVMHVWQITVKPELAILSRRSNNMISVSKGACGIRLKGPWAAIKYDTAGADRSGLHLVVSIRLKGPLIRNHCSKH
jgi:hypothetical protein